MKSRKIRWNRLLGCLLIFAFGIYIVQSYVLDSKILWKEKGTIHIQDLPDSLKSKFTDLQKQYGGDERFKDMLQNYSKYPEELLELAIRNKDAFPFVYRYPIRKKIVLDEPLHENVSEIPALYQWDERWGYASYGDGLMALTGCGPTALSMVLSYLKEDPSITPLRIARFSEQNNLYVNGAGTSWDLFRIYSKTVSIHCMDIELTKQALQNSLSKGHPIIASMNPGDFTTTGHLIVLTGLDADGKVIVHDPNSSTRTKKHWELSSVAAQIAAAWEFTNE